jgi:hypothetical protein
MEEMEEVELVGVEAALRLYFTNQPSADWNGTANSRAYR